MHLGHLIRGGLQALTSIGELPLKGVRRPVSCQQRPRPDEGWHDGPSEFCTIGVSFRPEKIRKFLPVPSGCTVPDPL